MPKVAKNATYEIKPQAHLVNIIKTTKEHHPNFVLFLGAGASVTSNVELVGTMVDRWRSQHHQTYGREKSLEVYLNEQTWYRKSNEYSTLFEEIYDQPSQRREFIEFCLKQANPSWGYIFLVNLLANGVFNTVFTTNFDDLLNEACYRFSEDVRPIVCAHDSSIRSVRITSKRPKIIKLHGDFLFDNIKNTCTELESLETNMKEKLKQYASEFGFIVVGYAGHDRSVMEPLTSLLRQDSNFPHGIYWCIRKGAEISENVQSLAHFPRFRLVEIAGFDELFAEIHEAMEFKLQPAVSDPYNALSRRLNNLIQDANTPNPPHPVMRKYIETIGERIAHFTSTQNSDGKQNATKEVKSDTSASRMVRIPFVMLSQISRRVGKYEEAIKYLLDELDVQPSMIVFQDAVTLIAENKHFEYMDNIMNRIRSSKSELSRSPERTFDISLPLISAGKYVEAQEILELGHDAALKNPSLKYDEVYYWLNRLQIKTHMNEPFTPEEKDRLQQIAITGNELSKMGASILLGNYEDAERYLKLSIEKRMVNPPSSMLGWPIIALLRPHLQQSLDEIFGTKASGVVPRALREITIQSQLRSTPEKHIASDVKEPPE